ncbi:MAG: hypothetical protein AAFN41_05135 [Planctomycetota bacterium]
MDRTSIAAAALLAVAGSTAAQDLFVFANPIAFNGNTTTWEIQAEFFGTPPSDIVQIWADASFELFNPFDDQSSITILNYNSSYDTSLGQAVITDNGSNRPGFVGNANSFFGTPDASNPLTVMTVEVVSDVLPRLCLDLVGQNSAIFDLAPFGDVRLYQDAQGNAGELTFEFFCIPAPSAAALLGLGGLAAARRRR